MINNRQNGRRRGRGGGQRSPNNVPNAGNRQDNRQRGNAAQLHEKYKALARDAQLSGDRVQTEFYLQFADHYFRVLNEGRARFEEQRRQRDDYAVDEEDQDDALIAGDGDEREMQDVSEGGYNGADTRRQERARDDRQHRERPRFEAREQDRSDFERPRDKRDNADVEDTGERISVEVLPPAIAADAGAEAPRAPRRRTRRPRTEGGDTEIAPAA